MIGLGDTVYFYDGKDRERPAIIIRMVGELVNNGRDEGVFTYTAKLKGSVQGLRGGLVDFVEDKHGVQIIPNEKGNIAVEEWGIAFRPVLPVRVGSVVQIENWNRILKCKVLGLIESNLFRRSSFVFEGISVLEKNPGSGDIGRFKGHHFTASPDQVKKVYTPGKGKRLLVFGPYLTKAENKKIFGL